MSDPHDYDDDFDNDECWNCAGEGFLANCWEEWACVSPEYGCDDCRSPCDVCNPRKVSPEVQELRQILGEALAEATPDAAHHADEPREGQRSAAEPPQIPPRTSP